METTFGTLVAYCAACIGIFGTVLGLLSLSPGTMAVSLGVSVGLINLFHP